MINKIALFLLLVFVSCTVSPQHYVNVANKYEKRYGLVNWKKAERYYELSMKKGIPLQQVTIGYEQVFKNIISLYLYYRKYDYADTYIKRADKYYEDDNDIKFLRAIYYIKTGKFDKGSFLLRHLRERGYRKPDILYGFATMYFMKGDYKDAIDYLEQIKAQYSGSGKIRINDVLSMLAYSEYSIKDYTGALAVYGSLLKIEKSIFMKSRIAKNIASIYIVLGDPDSAKRYVALSDKLLKELRTENPKKWMNKK